MFLPLKDNLVATFSETRAPTSRKYVAEQDTMMPNWSKTFQNFWSHFSVFALEKQPKNLNFQSVFTSKRPFGGYFLWNACTYFQKICSWTRYSDSKLSKNISNFLAALLRFSFRKVAWKSKFSEFFLSLKEALVAAFHETSAFTSRLHEVEQVVLISNWSETFQVFWSHSSVFILE